MAHMRIGLIGAGRVGAVLAAALRDAGHHIVAASGSSPASRTRLETLLPEARPAGPDAVARDADLVLLTVPDDALAAVVATLVADGAISAGQVVVHTSGHHGVAVLEPAARAGACVVALHPAMTFTGTDVDLARLPLCVFGVTTADDAAAEVARSLVADLGATMTVVTEEHRAMYHAALAHGSNHLVTLVTQALGLLQQAGTQDPSATLRPLLEAALDNALDYGDAALTGPVVRGDRETIDAHLDALADAPAPTFDAYLAMARVTAGLSVADGRLSRERAREITDRLDVAAWDFTAAQMADDLGRPHG